MTVNQIARQLLTHFAPEERSIPDATDYPDRNSWILEAINGALQEVFSDGSQWVRKAELGVLLHAPTAVTVTVANGQATATVTSGWAAWMAGCSIVIDGASVDNRILNDSASVVLKYPFDGQSGSKSATVYQDCVALSAEALKVFEPIRVNRRPVYPWPDPTELNSVDTHDFGFHRHGPTVTPDRRVGETSGQALGYTVDAWSPSATSPPALLLRLQPAPEAQGFLDYTVMLKPPVVASLQSSTALPIPFGFDESLFLAIARKRLTDCPFFRSDAAAAQINDGYLKAVAQLKELNPKRKSGCSIVAAY